MREISRRKEWVEAWNTIKTKLHDTKTLLELAQEVNDESYVNEITAELHSIEQSLSDLEFRNMLSGEDDNKNCILTIHAGAGGTEAQDWAEMLMRMYLRWCDKKNYKTSMSSPARGLVLRA